MKREYLFTRYSLFILVGLCIILKRIRVYILLFFDIKW